MPRRLAGRRPVSTRRVPEASSNDSSSRPPIYGSSDPRSDAKLDEHVSFGTPHVQGNLVYSISQSDLWIGLSTAYKFEAHC